MCVELLTSLSELSVSRCRLDSSEEESLLHKGRLKVSQPNIDSKSGRKSLFLQGKLIFIKRLRE